MNAKIKSFLYLFGVALGAHALRTSIGVFSKACVDIEPCCVSHWATIRHVTPHQCNAKSHDNSAVQRPTYQTSHQQPTDRTNEIATRSRTLQQAQRRTGPQTEPTKATKTPTQQRTTTAKTITNPAQSTPSANAQSTIETMDNAQTGLTQLSRRSGPPQQAQRKTR